LIVICKHNKVVSIKKWIETIKGVKYFCPWLGISPDGFSEKLNDYFLIEIKCPISGKKFSG